MLLDAVPKNPDNPMWAYDYMCPEGTFVTRFFGKAGEFLSTITAQCSRVWNLKTVGLPAFTQPGDIPFQDTSVAGYRGIVVRSQGSRVDVISFLSFEAAVASPFYGNAVMCPRHD